MLLLTGEEQMVSLVHRPDDVQPPDDTARRVSLLSLQMGKEAMVLAVQHPDESQVQDDAEKR